MGNLFENQAKQIVNNYEANELIEQIARSLEQAYNRGSKECALLIKNKMDELGLASCI